MMTNRIDINTADEAALIMLPGIGEALARAIITYRKERGGFRTLQELTAVPGISEALLHTLTDHLFLTLPEATLEPTGEPEDISTEDVSEAAAPPAENAADDAAGQTPSSGQERHPPEPAATREQGNNMRTEPESTSPRPQPSTDSSFERRAVRRGCFSIIFGAVLGAFIGTALTLSILSALNNSSLSYNDAAINLSNQLDDEVATREMIIETQAAAMDEVAADIDEQATLTFAELLALEESLATRQGQLSAEQEILETQQAELQLQQNELVTRQVEAQATLESAYLAAAAEAATMDADIAGLQVTAVYLETRIAQAGNAADTLNAFLLGLDDLLSDVSTATSDISPTATLSATATITGTPVITTTATITPTATVTTTAVISGSATITP